MTNEFDPDAAAAELAALSGLTNLPARDAGMRLIATAALVDIADSLRTLAVKAAVELGAAGHLDALDIATEGPGDEPVDLTRADVGTRVKLIRGAEAHPAYPFGRLTGEHGVDQGTPWVGVQWENEDGQIDPEAVSRIFATDLMAAPFTIEELADSPVPLVGVATEEEAPALRADDDGDGEPAVGGYDDDIDADFDGDRHTAAADAVAALKARRKTAKGKK